MDPGAGEVAPPSPGLRVTVCVCTFRRPQGLQRLLDGLGSQRFEHGPPPDLLVLVIDNEGSEQARRLCERAAAEHRLALRYLVEDRRGISFARNRALEAVPEDTDFVAMIDDDERPEPDWLEALLLAQTATGADVVQGRVRSRFSADVPAWIRDGGFFGYPLPPSPFRGKAWTDLQEIPSAATNNVLVRAAALAAGGARFDPRLALTGGSDALFFRKLKAAGRRLVYAEGAVVHEDVPAARAGLGYLWLRSYRDGSKRLAAKLEAKGAHPGEAWRARIRLGGRAVRQALTAVLWLLGRGLRGEMTRITLAQGLVELANALGTLAACAGLRYQHYRRAGEAASPAAGGPAATGAR